MRRKIVILLILFWLIAVPGSVSAQPEILNITTYLSTNGVHAGAEFQAAVVVILREPWHINSANPGDEFVIPTVLQVSESDDYQITKIVYPAHEEKIFAFYDEPLAVYKGEVVIIVEGILAEDVAGSVTLRGRLSYQGCNDQLCLAPAEMAFFMEIPVLSADAPVIFQNEHYFRSRTTGSEESSAFFDVNTSFARKGMVITFLLIFLGGLGLNLTPCVYPLIPITVSYFGGQTAGKSGKRLLLALLYVLGIAVVNSALGTAAALTGGLLGSLMTNPVVLLIIAGILVALALSMFGVYELSAPSFLMNLSGGSRTGYFGALSMGLTMGIVAAPCIGPFVVGLLTYVASTGNPMIGFSMFFTLSLGLGLPFIFLAFFSSKIERLPRSGEWMVGVRTIFGLVLLGMALYFLQPLIPDGIYGWLFPLYMIGAGVYLLIFNRTGENTRGFVMFKRLIAVAVIIAGTWFLKPEPVSGQEMAWQPYSENLYQAALIAGQPIIIDFYADWCIPCREMDNVTFTDPAVIDLSRQFRLLKVDLTAAVSPEIRRLREKFEIKGVPTILFIDQKGNERDDLRVLGFEKPEHFIVKMKNTLS
ncbi:MAG TPA: thiol:disulfide interchange protein [Candidatus Marinimicrobia bacterium]|nr:thiol:disulfide interchange protein [Candidatus Neomarinimicrobiota bacterium]